MISRYFTQGHRSDEARRRVFYEIVVRRRIVCAEAGGGLLGVDVEMTAVDIFAT